MCAKSAGTDRPKSLHLEPEFFERLLPEASSANFSMLLGFGEPLASPRFFDWLDTLVNNGCTNITSLNGLLLTEEKSRRLIESGIAQVSFSLDAVTSETYEKIRRGGNFHKALENIRRFVQLRNERGNPVPYPRLTLCLLRDNLHEVAEFADLAKSLGIDFISIMDPVFYSQDMAERYSFPLEEGQKAVAALRTRCEQLGVFFDYFEDSYYVYLDSKALPIGEQKEPPAVTYQNASVPLVCPMLYSTLFVRADGLVAPCCYLYENVIGDLNRSTVSDIWFGKQLAEYRRLIREGDLPPGCRVCRRLIPQDKRLIWKNGKTFMKYTWQTSAQRRKEGFALQPLFFIM